VKFSKNRGYVAAEFENTSVFWLCHNIASTVESTLNLSLPKSTSRTEAATFRLNCLAARLGIFEGDWEVLSFAMLGLELASGRFGWK
jgi:hypothetical protein